MAKLKLIGAKTFISRPMGIDMPVSAGGIVEVDEQFVEHLLGLVYREGKHSYPVFSADLDAEIKTKHTPEIPLEERLANQQRIEEQARAATAEREAREAAEARNAELQERIEKLEQMMEAQGQSAAENKAAAKPAGRRRKTAEKDAA